MLHFGLLMPALRDLHTRANVEQLKDVKFSHEEAEKFFPPFPTLKAHVEQYHRENAKIAFILDELLEFEQGLPLETRGFLRGEIEEPQSNHILGRLLQAFYAQRTENFEQYNLPEFTGDYLSGGNNIFERTKTYVLNRLRTCPLPINDEGKVATPLNAQEILQTYCWFSCPTVVEMVEPKLQGAANGAAQKLCDFLDTLYERTGIDLTEFEAPEITASTIELNSNMARQAQRLAWMIALLEQDTETDNSLAKIANKIWHEKASERKWKNVIPFQPKTKTDMRILSKSSGVIEERDLAI